MRLRTPVVGLTAALAAAVLAVTGCSTAPDAADASGAEGVAETPVDRPSAPVLQPGAPGEPNRTLGPDEVGDIGEMAYNDADVEFLTHMIPHHFQAVQMGELAEEHAVDGDLRRLASRIHDSQLAEIAGMEQWLREHDQPLPTYPVTDTSGHLMPGMLTEAQLEELAEARGAAFDRLFAQRMIAHHEGALEMADLVLADGVDQPVRDLAADVATSQTVEIEVFEQMLTRL